MRAKDRTKQIFADTIIQIMKTKSFKDIRVKELCELCDIDRQVFYYHFMDKYDLIAYIYQKDFDKIFTYDISIDSDIQQITRFLLLIDEKKIFYRSVLCDTGQNSLLEHIFTTNSRLTIDNYKKLHRLTELSDDDIFVIRFYTYGWTHSLIKWINGEIPVDAQHMAQLLSRCIEPLYR